ncbi:MAG: alanine racemase [Candidatus Hodarchaeales archaeon]|jgi:D-serine deaminase-like pyridoxal phosphate-dependent protein
MLDIKKPTAIIDEKRVRRNIERIAKKTSRSGIVFRPHFKTHQSIEIGEWFKDYGVSAITVSSLDMAEYFVKNGWNDITVAIPVNIRQIGKINDLAKKIILNLVTESRMATQSLIESLTESVNILIEIDVGYHRTGVLWSDTDEIEKIATMIENADLLQFKGILTHSGHAYHVKTLVELERIHLESVSRMNFVKTNLLSKGYKDIQISIGDTPTCSVTEDYSDVDEIRPGNMVFYDLTQFELGACEEKSIALVVVCPVIAKYPKRNEIVVYGGGVHLSKDYLELESGIKFYGRIALPKDNGWSNSVKNAVIASLSQ